jgi:hypothetical protein
MNGSLFLTESSVFAALLSLLLAAFAQAQHTLSSQGSQILSTHRRRPADVEQLLSFASSKPKHWRNATSAFSSEGRCLALAGNGEAQVNSSTGRTLWKWNYGKINRCVVQDR